MEFCPPSTTPEMDGEEIVEKRSLIVNYLPQSMTEKNLFQIFVPYGYIESLKIMRDVATGYSYGFAFVNYTTEKSAMEAQEKLDGYKIGYKRLKVSIARPPSDDIKGANLFVSNIPLKCTERDLQTWFGQFGRIVNYSMLRDKLTSKSRGMGFVRFESRDEALKALKLMQNFVPPEFRKPIKVKVAEEHGKQKAAFVAGFNAALKQSSTERGLAFLKSDHQHHHDDDGDSSTNNKENEIDPSSSIRMKLEALILSSDKASRKKYYDNRGEASGCRFGREFRPNNRSLSTINEK